MTRQPDAAILVATAHSPSFHQLYDLLRKYKDPYLVGVDRGALKLIHRGLMPELAVGDFDSVTVHEKKLIKQQSMNYQEADNRKDDTDLELALAAVQERFPTLRNYYIFGGIGSGNHQGRIDHLLGNIWLGFQPRFQDILDQLTFVEDDSIIKYYGPGDHELHARHHQQYLSIFTLGSVKNLSIQKAAYPLAPQDIDYPKAFLSNHFLNSQRPIALSFDQGKVLVIWQLENPPNHHRPNFFR